MHLLVDGTGLKLCGPGEWLAHKHGTKRRRAWRGRCGTISEAGGEVRSHMTRHPPYPIASRPASFALFGNLQKC